MAITSETQRRYDPQKGGYAYFTLFRSSEKGERPEWAQDGDILEENCEGGGNYECKRDAKGRIKWDVASDWDRQTGGGSGGGSGGGGAEKFVVTLTEANDTWTADKTIAEIVAADTAGKIVVAVRKAHEPLGTDVEIPLSYTAAMADVSGCSFCGVTDTSATKYLVSALGMNQGSDAWQVTTTPIPTSSNAPLIVTLTEGATEGQLVGDKTYQECYTAFYGGRRVTFNATIESVDTSASVLAAGLQGGNYSLAAYFGDGILSASGAATDYVTFNLQG